MIAAQFAAQSVDISTPELVEDETGENYGNDTFEYGDPVTTPDAVLTPLEVTEQVDPAREAVVTRYLLVLPAGTTISAHSRVTYDGIDFEVDGEPQRFETGVADHVEAVLQRVRG
jgi:hypothetical protein